MFNWIQLGDPCISEVSRVANHVGALHACDHERKKYCYKYQIRRLKAKKKNDFLGNKDNDKRDWKSRESSFHFLFKNGRNCDIYTPLGASIFFLSWWTFQ